MALRANDTDDVPFSPLPGLSYFWQDAEKTPTSEWANWAQLFEMAVLARHSISISEVLKNPTENDPSIPALLGNLTVTTAAKKVVSLLYLSIGKTGRKMLTDKFPNTNIFVIDLAEILQRCTECFEVKGNRTLDRHSFFSRKQQPEELLHQFWNVLNGLAAKCDFGEQTQSLVYDMFVLNMSNKQVQERLCTEPRENPRDALQFAIAFEEGIRRQKTIGQPCTSVKVKEEPVFMVAGHKDKKECWRCGAGNFTAAHLKVCRAPETNCNYCGVKGHIENCCNSKQKDRLKKVAIPKNFDKKFNNARRVQRVDYYEEDQDSDSDEMVLNVETEGTNKSEPYYMEGWINGFRFKTMIDTGSPVTIFAVDEIKRIMRRADLQVRPMVDEEKYVDFNGKPLKLLGYVFCQLQVGEKVMKKARVLVAREGMKSIVGREWLSTLKFKMVQKPVGESEINIIEKEGEKLSQETKALVNEFPNLFSRKGKIKDHKIRIKMKENASISQQKGRRIPIQMQKAVDSEIKRLLKEGHMERVDEIKEDVFIQPTVITVKKDRSVKKALDARALNKAIYKDKNQMPNLDNLMEMIAERLDNSNGEVWYSSVDLTYAYGQIPLHALTAKHCNFQIIGGESTGTYRFVTGFYGLTVMPTEFQKVMDNLLARFREVFVFIDDILIVTKGTKSEHLTKVREILNVLDLANLQIKADKCKIAQNQIEWLGFKLTSSGVTRVNTKVQGITDRLRPTNLKELRSFLGAVNQLNKFIPDLAAECFPFRSILKKDAEWK